MQNKNLQQEKIVQNIVDSDKRYKLVDDIKLYFINSYKNYFLYSSYDGTLLYEAQGYKDDFSPVTDLLTLTSSDKCNKITLNNLQFYSWLYTGEENIEWLQNKLNCYKL